MQSVKNIDLLLDCLETLLVQCNLDLVTLNLVTTYDLVTIVQKPFFNLLRKIIQFSDIINLVTVFAETKSVTKLRLHCTFDNFNI
jgi:hypothetical protein